MSAILIVTRGQKCKSDSRLSMETRVSVRQRAALTCLLSKEAPSVLLAVRNKEFCDLINRWHLPSEREPQAHLRVSDCSVQVMLVHESGFSCLIHLVSNTRLLRASSLPPVVLPP